MEERRLQVWRKLRAFRDMQRVYMPRAQSLIDAEDNERLCKNLPHPAAEDAKLWLPSELPADVQLAGCVTNLPAMESRLRIAQCDESLDTIRGLLHAKKHLINRRNKNATGQKRSSRARTLIGRVGDRTITHLKKYTRARDAVFALGGVEEFGTKYKVLLREHLVLDGEELQVDHEASRRMNRAGGGGPRSARKVKEGTSESSKVLSWIWVSGEIPGQQGGLHECKWIAVWCSQPVLMIGCLAVRREYLKARARKHRWTEEVLLLIEEMRRVLRFLDWRANWWRDREFQWEGLDNEVSDGLRAYALRQAATYSSIAANFQRKWAQTDVKAARDASSTTSALLGLEDTIMQ